MYKVEFSKQAEKQFDKLDFEIQGRILNVLERMKIRPYSFVKRRVGTPYFRARVGKYRLILDIQNEKLVIYVIELGLRKNIYKN